MVPGTETPGQPAQLSGSQHRPPPLAVNGSFRDPSSVNLPSWWQPYTEGNESLGTLSSSQPWKSVQGGPEKNRGPPPLPEDENEGLSLLESLPEDPPQIRLRRERLALMANYQADDYDVQESDVYRELVLGTSQRQFHLENFTAWLSSFMIGVINGCFGATFNLAINQLNSWKYSAAKEYITPGGGWAVPYLIMMAFSVLYATVAGVLGSYVSPQAAGSGIPEIRAYLNGIHISNLLSIRTLLAKTFGVSFAIASGLVAGKEGPFIHIGAILGAGVSKRGSLSVTRWTGGKLQARLRGSLGQYFKQPVETRDFVAAGSAAGISTAFGAPIGGVLFAIEQGSSWFSTRMLWHAVLAAGTALYITLIILEAYTDNTALWYARLAEPLEFVFKLSGSTGSTSAHEQYTWVSWEILVFILMGVVAGLLGALIVHMNALVVAYRVRWVQRTQRFRRVVEVVILAAITTTIWFFISYTSPCIDKPTLSGDNATAALDQSITSQLWCENPNQYSARGIFFFEPLSGAVSRLYYSRVDQIKGDVFVYDSAALGLMFFLVYVLIAFSYGSSAACGIFVPTVVAGAAGGRLVSKGMRSLVTSLGVSQTILPISGQSYAVVGSAALLGGVTRMQLSSCVLIMETSGASALVVPLVFATTVAKIVADFFGPGLYDVTMTRNGYPFLPAEAEDLNQMKLHQQLTASDVMTPNPECMPAIVKIRDLIHMLRTTTFNTFPLVARPVTRTPVTYLGGSSAVANENTLAGVSPMPRPLQSGAGFASGRGYNLALGGASLRKNSLSRFSQRLLSPRGDGGSGGGGAGRPGQLPRGLSHMTTSGLSTAAAAAAAGQLGPPQDFAAAAAAAASMHTTAATAAPIPISQPSRALSKAISMGSSATGPGNMRGVPSLSRLSSQASSSQMPPRPGSTRGLGTRSIPLQPRAQTTGAAAAVAAGASDDSQGHVVGPRPGQLTQPRARRLPSLQRVSIASNTTHSSATGLGADGGGYYAAAPLSPRSAVQRGLAAHSTRITDVAREVLEDHTGVPLTALPYVSVYNSNLYAPSTTMTSTPLDSPRQVVGSPDGVGGWSPRSGNAPHTPAWSGVFTSPSTASPDPSAHAGTAPGVGAAAGVGLSKGMPAEIALAAAAAARGAPPDPPSAPPSAPPPPPHLPQAPQQQEPVASTQHPLDEPFAQALSITTSGVAHLSASQLVYQPPLEPHTHTHTHSDTTQSLQGDSSASTAGQQGHMSDLNAALSDVTHLMQHRVATSRSDTDPESPPSAIVPGADASLSYMHAGAIRDAVSAARQGSHAAAPAAAAAAAATHAGLQTAGSTTSQTSFSFGTPGVKQPAANAAQAMPPIEETRGDGALADTAESPTGAAAAAAAGGRQSAEWIMPSLNTSPVKDEVPSPRAPASPTAATAAAAAAAVAAEQSAAAAGPAAAAARHAGLGTMSMPVVPSAQLPPRSRSPPLPQPIRVQTPFATATSLVAGAAGGSDGDTPSAIAAAAAGLTRPSIATTTRGDELNPGAGGGDGGASTLVMDGGLYTLGAGGGEVDATIVGVISRKTLLKLLQVRVGFTKSAAEAQGTVDGGVLAYPAALVSEVVRKLDVDPLKVPTSAEGQEALFNELSEEELDSYINLRHYMQRVPFALPCNASLSQAYRLFRSLGLHHMLVTTGDAPVVGVITRSDLVPDHADVVMHDKLDRSLQEAEEEAKAWVAMRKSFSHLVANIARKSHIGIHHHDHTNGDTDAAPAGAVDGLVANGAAPDMQLVDTAGHENGQAGTLDGVEGVSGVDVGGGKPDLPPDLLAHRMARRGDDYDPKRPVYSAMRRFYRRFTHILATPDAGVAFSQPSMRRPGSLGAAASGDTGTPRRRVVSAPPARDGDVGSPRLLSPMSPAAALPAVTPRLAPIASAGPVSARASLGQQPLAPHLSHTHSQSITHAHPFSGPPPILPQTFSIPKNATDGTHILNPIRSLPRTTPTMQPQTQGPGHETRYGVMGTTTTGFVVGGNDGVGVQPPPSVVLDMGPVMGAREGGADVAGTSPVAGHGHGGGVAGSVFASAAAQAAGAAAGVPIGEPWQSPRAPRLPPADAAAVSMPIGSLDRAARIAELRARLERSNRMSGKVEGMIAGTYQPALDEEAEALGVEARDYGMPLPGAGRTTCATDESTGAGATAAARRAAAAATAIDWRRSVDVPRGATRDYVAISPRQSLQGRPSLQAMDSNYPGVWHPFNG